MKILHVITHMGIKSGAARIVADLIPFQIKAGMSVDVLSFIDIQPSYVSEMENLGCHFMILKGNKEPKYNLFLVNKLIPIIKKYEIVHVHLFPALYWVALAKILSNARCKLLVTEHSTENNRRGKWWLKPIERFIYNQYDLIISITDAVKDLLLKEVTPSTSIITIENGICISSFRNVSLFSRKEYNLPEDAILITQVAGFRLEKDQKTVLRALSYLPKKYHAVFIGEGELLDLHKQIALDLKVADRCHFLGLRQDVPSLLAISDIVVLSSNFEGFGLAAVEGMAANKPVIASDVPGLSNVVKGAGLLFPVQDERMLVNQIKKLAEKKYYNQIQRQCKERADFYDIEKMALSYQDVYLHLMNNKI